MEVVDADWIKARLTNRHGEKVEIARAMGIDVQKLSKILKGVRQVQANEIPGLLRYFKSGLAEAPAAFDQMPVRVAKNLTDDAAALIARLAPNSKNVAAYRASRTHLEFGILQGDLLAVDISKEPEDGDVVIATQTNTDTGESNTTLGRYAENWIIQSDASKNLLRISDDGTIAILGVIRGCIRSAAF